MADPVQNIRSFDVQFNQTEAVLPEEVHQLNAEFDQLNAIFLANIDSIDAKLESFAAISLANIHSFFPPSQATVTRYFMRCKNSSSGQFVYWLADFLDTNGSESGIPQSDVTDVCLIEVVV